MHLSVVSRYVNINHIDSITLNSGFRSCILVDLLSVCPCGVHTNLVPCRAHTNLGLNLYCLEFYKVLFSSAYLI